MTGLPDDATGFPDDTTGLPDDTTGLPDDATRRPDAMSSPPATWSGNGFTLWVEEFRTESGSDRVKRWRKVELRRTIRSHCSRY